MNYKYFKGNFKGISSTKDLVINVGKNNFYNFYWNYIQINTIESIDFYDVEKEKIGDYYYSKKIKPKTWWWHYYWITSKPDIIVKKDFFWIEYINYKFPKLRKRPEVFIPITENNYYNGNLHDILIKDIKLDNNNLGYISRDYVELTGTIYFKIEIPDIKIPENTNNDTDIGTNVSGVIEDSESANTIKKLEEEFHNPVEITNKIDKKNPDNDGRTFPKLSMGWLSIILGVFFWLILLSFFWVFFHKFFFIILIAFVGWLVTRFVNNRLLKNIFNFIFIGALLFFLFNLFSGKDILTDPTVTKKDGKIKVSPPKPIKKEGASIDDIDYQITKEINWFDFISNNYDLKYNTSVQSFFETQKKHATEEENYRNTSKNPLSYFNKLFTKLEQLDEHKIDSIVKVLSTKANAKKLNQLQTAEMVTTFIQEIPYVLVHQNTCQQIIQSEPNNSFIVEYHRDKKPCLANVPGGIQSPYEFLHNLKGDCDTRSLLGFAILKKLNISASVWVSQAYGHSILGIGLPVGNGVCKNINGLNHYAVELTNKGFRLGMISPQQRDMSNWDIALYNNNFK